MPSNPSALRVLAAACLAAVLGGCQAVRPRPAEAPPPPPPAAVVIAVPAPAEAAPPPAAAPTADPVAQALARADAIARLAPAELGREIARLGDSEDAAPENPLLLAVALAQTRQPADTARALGLVQRVLGNAAAPALHPLARLLESRLLQQRRLEDQLDKQAQQLREAQRRNEQLNERLEAVRAIERSLSTRPAPPPPANGTKPMP
ncbi:MAG: hypothetical protein QM569_05205 [Acidovorax sp.]|uniref:hypothetical protein n=1 Tax=Acidovorax sp. TaxID=1872122 RepID=UPI0039E620AC